MNSAYGYLLAAIIGAVSAYYVQGLRWDAEVASIRDSASSELAAAYEQQAEKVKALEARKEELQNEYLAFKDAEAKRNADIGSGVKRVYVRATCPAVPAASTDTGRIEVGSAELDSAARRTLSDLRIGVEEQRRLLNVCRAELMTR